MAGRLSRTREGKWMFPVLGPGRVKEEKYERHYDTHSFWKTDELDS
jgi:hypothetical protein